jgi:hypothetical protein
MAALNDSQSKELCKKIEQHILKNGYFIFDTDDWDGLHIEYKPFTYGKNYEYADYTEITVTFDGYNVTDKLQVKYNFIKSIYAERTGDSYRVYYKRENGEKDGSRPYNMNEAAEFIANRFIGLVEDKIMDKKLTLEQRITRLEKLLKLNRSTCKFEGDFSMSNLQTQCDELRVELRDTFPDTPVHAKMANGKIYVDYGPDDDDLYLEFQVVPERRGFSVSMDGDLTGKAQSMGNVFDMIVEAIRDEQAW